MYIYSNPMNKLDVLFILWFDHEKIGVILIKFQQSEFQILFWILELIFYYVFKYFFPFCILLEKKV